MHLPQLTVLRPDIWRPDGRRLAQRLLYRTCFLAPERLQGRIQYHHLLIWCLDCPHGWGFPLPLTGAALSTWWQCLHGCNRHLLPRGQLELFPHNDPEERILTTSQRKGSADASP